MTQSSLVEESCAGQCALWHLGAAQSVGWCPLLGSELYDKAGTALDREGLWGVVLGLQQLYGTQLVRTAILSKVSGAESEGSVAVSDVV